MKKYALMLIVLVLAHSLHAQKAIKTIADSARHVTAAPDTIRHWQINGIGSLNFNQAYLVNWAAGGQSALGMGALFNFQANYKSGKHVWNNNINLGYGFNLQAPGSSESQFRKTDDHIELNTSYGYGLSKHWDLSVLVNFKTQFSAGYKYPDDSNVISNFMAPGYLIAGLGFTWVPTHYFNVFLSPAAGRFTFVLDKKLSDAGAFGVDSSKTMRGEFGPYIRAAFNKDLAKNINMNTTLELFTNYLKDFGSTVVNWNFLLTIKANKWLATTISTTLIYDPSVMITDLQGKTGPRTQFQENIAVGIAYTIHQKKRNQ
jgi:hypothetical protein